MEIREAVPSDAEAVSEMLSALVAAGKRTRPSDAGFVLEAYISNPLGIRTSVAVEGDEILGIQILSRAYEGNPYGAPLGSGIIGTHAAPWAARRGVGRALFQATLGAAREAGLQTIEAFIHRENAEGHGYYGAMGFEPVREDGDALVRSFRL
ncbi:MAG: GNAT family N-acetyltransferase [Pseudomonadota bacterium]